MKWEREPRKQLRECNVYMAMTTSPLPTRMRQKTFNFGSNRA
jgi:hypothetical protein